MDNLCLATFSYIVDGKRTALNGMIDPILSVFSAHTKEITIIDGAHPGSSTVATKYESYRKGKLIHIKTSLTSKILDPFLLAVNGDATNPLFKLRDFFSALEFGILRKKKIDIFIGLESIYTIAGILLKKLGKVKTVVYYVSDYSPTRYHSKIFNNLYLALDRYCCYQADFIWDVSPAMIAARQTVGLDKKRTRPVILVRNALFPNQLTYISPKKRIKHSIVFAGTFGSENGTVLLIKAMQHVIKTIPDATLHFYGGNKEQEVSLLALVKEYRLERVIFFHGLITNAEKLSKTINRYQIGAAPYVAIPGSPRWFADATKIRLYLGCGLPVITTQVPPLGKEVAEKGAAVIVHDDQSALASGIVKMMTSEKSYHAMADAAIRFAKTNTWENTYTNACKKMGIEL